MEIYRLCQTRVFVQSSSLKDVKVERSCKTKGVQPLKIFDYNDFLSDIQKINYQNANNGDVWIKLGSEDVKVLIKPIACDAIYQNVFRPSVDIKAMASIPLTIDKEGY